MFLYPIPVTNSFLKQKNPPIWRVFRYFWREQMEIQQAI